MRYYSYTPIIRGMVKIQNMTTPDAGEDVQQQEPQPIVGRTQTVTAGHWQAVSYKISAFAAKKQSLWYGYEHKQAKNLSTQELPDVLAAVFTMPKFESKQEAIQQVKGKTNCELPVFRVLQRRAETLCRNLWTVTHQGSSVHRILGQGCWRWVAMPSAGGSS